MNVLFWISVGFLSLLSPFVFRLDGSFCLNKKTAFVSVRLYGARVFSALFYFSEEGVSFSLYGKKGKPIILKDNKDKKNISFRPTIDCLRFTDFSVKINIGANVENATGACLGVQAIIDASMRFLEDRKLLDKGYFVVFPSYTSDQMMVNFSISGFTSPIKFISSFAHTKKGEEYAK